MKRRISALLVVLLAATAQAQDPPKVRQSVFNSTISTTSAVIQFTDSAGPFKARSVAIYNDDDTILIYADISTNTAGATNTASSADIEIGPFADEGAFIVNFPLSSEGISGVALIAASGTPAVRVVALRID